MHLRDTKVTLQAANANLSGSEFADVNLSGAQFTDVNLSQAAFTDINFTGTKLTDVNLSHVEITDCCVEGMKINGTLIAPFLRKYRHPGDQSPALPVATLVKACETACVAGCCGIGAFDFSPIHMASCLMYGSGTVTDDEVQGILTALHEWREKHGAATGAGYNSDGDEMNDYLSPADVETFCDLIERNLKVAVELIRSMEHHPRSIPAMRKLSES